MDKLYYIVCEEKGATLFEGKFQGRTRGAAMKFLKERLGRQSLTGVVFTITEIPVPIIREIVEAIMRGEPVAAQATATPAATAPPAPQPSPEEKVVRFDAFEQPEVPVNGEARWSEIRNFYRECRSPKKTAERFCVSVNTIKARIRREEW
ncbi:MAG TPA: hypothetical protein PLU30_17315 [Verrucomicrobiae bacterium]|nr:hypothetical protein [Verrucomicrobiae bacterium]